MNKETLRNSLIGMLMIFITFLCGSVTYVIHQTNETHQQNIINLTENLDKTRLHLQKQIENLAKNELIINSTVDNNTRDNYLPLFFRSFNFHNSSESSIVFTDHLGKIITGNNVALHQEYTGQFNWQKTVFSGASPYVEHSENELFIAVPVLFSGLPKGAIIAYLSNLQPLVPAVNSNSTLIYLNKNNQVLYSSNNQLIAQNSFFIEKNFRLWSKHKQPYLSGQVISIEPPLSAYGNLLWLIILISLLLVFNIFTLISNIKSNEKYASNSMKELQKTLTDAIVHDGNIDVAQKDNEPIEFFAIRQELNIVLKNLFDQTISLEKCTSIINSLGEILLVLDVHQNIILINNSFSQFCNNIGLSVPQNLSQIIPEKHLTVEDKKSNFNMEYQLSCQNNSDNLIILQWNTSHYRDKQGKILGIILVGKDITLAKKLEVELLIKTQAIDEAQTSIIITDAQQRHFPVIYANKAFCKLTGYSLNDIIGNNCRFMQGPSTNVSDIAKINKAISNKEAITITLTNYHKDGSEFQNELTINPISNKQGNITHFIGLQLDVTERQATANYLKLAKQKAEESTQLKSEFLATMSHEIRTPMNGIIGMLDILVRSQLTNEQLSNAEIAKDSAYALLTIINDILDFSKIESGKLEIENIAFDLISLFNSVLQTHAQQVHDKDVELIIDMTDLDVSSVIGDAGRIRQVLNNLISNATKFTEKGEVAITVKLVKQSKHRARLHCQISDTGIGIAENRLEHIFDSFTQADYSTTRLYGGTGLGLAITSKLCELMKGSVNVTSQKAVGSCFSFEIQLEIAESVEQDIPFKLNNTNILILDENKHSANVLKKQLQKWGANIVTEVNNESHTEYLEQKGLDLVFTDSSYTSGLAIELIEGLPLKTKEKITYILMTKANAKHNKSFVLGINFQHFLSKPITTDMLKLTLVAILNTPPLATEESCKAILPKERQPKQKLRILLVEDNRINQLVAKKVLSELSCDTTIVSNGEEAISTLNETLTPFTLIFMDCQMPILDGYQATKKIRAGAAGDINRIIPIIAMTANAMKGDREKCLIHGMDDYISKPININILQEKINIWSYL
jgi:PAS domain S-box-containing protein